MMQGQMGQFGNGNFGGNGNLGGMSPYGFNNSSWMALPDLTWLLLLVIIALVAYLIFKKSKNSDLTTKKEPVFFKSSSQAENLVKQRYAKGEITDAEYETIMNTIRS